jgi:hypothetical protein
LGRAAFARFNAVPHYAYLKLKMPGPNGVITVNGNTERSLQTEEQTAAFAAEAQASEEAARSDKRAARSLKSAKAAQIDLGHVPPHPK